MFPKGNIYISGKSRKKGEKRISLPFLSRVFYHALRGAGAGLVALAILIFYFTYGPVIEQELKYQANEALPSTKEEKTFNWNEVVDTAEAERVTQVQKEAESFGVDSKFSVVIPKIDAASNIVANVDPANEEEYTNALKKGVAHAKGSYFPAQEENIFLFAHSTDSSANIARYNAVFYLLRKLEKGDKIAVYFSDKRYTYEVEEKVVADPDDVSWLTEDSEEERLVLQTCDPPGTTWNRLLVIAKPV